MHAACNLAALFDLSNVAALVVCWSCRRPGILVLINDCDWELRCASKAALVAVAGLSQRPHAVSDSTLQPCADAHLGSVQWAKAEGQRGMLF